MPAMHTLPVELTIYAVAEWHAHFQAWLAEGDADGQALNIDASAVSELDAAGVQLLTALANALARRDRPLLLERPSDTLTSVCTQLGASFLLTPQPEAA
jgi:anti-anti-sigma regulatory factor